MKKRRIALLCMGMLLLLLTACGKTANGKEDNVGKAAEQSQQAATETADQTESAAVSEKAYESLAVWPTYWDTDTVMSEIDTLQDKIDTICYFAAYFDANKQPFIPDQSMETYASVKAKYSDRNWTSYLTFVNDLLLPDGGSSLKDTDLLYTLLQDPSSRKNHINQILQMVQDNGFDGIEIDYEAIRKDMTLWKIFTQFITELNTEAQNRGILVRVLLEPSVPAAELTLPEGPEYVLMCYNLYGYGTEAGPKANQDFLIQMSQLLEQMPSPRNMAFSVGGFDFAKDGTVKQVTEAECVALQKQYKASTTRDEQSEDVVFSYTDANGMTHDVWYADHDTLQYWMKVGETYGIKRFTIWRLGSNVTLQ